VFGSGRQIACLEVEEADALQGTDSHGIQAQRFGPGVEGGCQIALVAENPAHEIVRVG
jgi:hypothetical protein